MRKVAAPMIRRMLDDAWVAAQDTDAIVHHPKTLAGPHLSERLGVPAYAACAVPMLTPTRAFPVPGLVKARAWAPRSTTRATGSPRPQPGPTRAPSPPGARRHSTSPTHPTDLDPPPTLYAYSEAVLPRPSDWGTETIVTGYWFLPPAPSWKPDAELQRFLGTGAPPVYVGFGSMPTDTRHAAPEVVAALRAAGVRGLIAGLDIEPADDMLAVEDVPHDWLFERVAVTVHHGGAGTVGAGLRAGKPAVIVPQGVDQPFWARAVHTAGAAPKPVDDLTHLADAITAATRLTPRAADLGRLLRREQGVPNAVAQLAGAPARVAA